MTHRSIRFRSTLLVLAACALAACEDDPTGPGADDLGPVAYMGQDPAQGSWRIFLADAASGTSRRLTQNDQDEVFPAWSPDREQLAYYVEGAGILYVINADGTNRRQVAQVTGVSDIVWSPNGGRLALERNITAEGGAGIWLIDIDGTDLTRLVAAPAGAPDWSPDGARIAFHVFGPFWNPAADGGRIDVVNVDGSNRRTLMQSPVGTWLRDPAWSPDGRSLAYARGNFDVSTLLVAGAEGESPRALTQPRTDDGYQVDLGPEWSRDGRWLTFGRQYPECIGTAPCLQRREIFVVRREGTGLSRITDAPNLTNGAPSW